MHRPFWQRVKCVQKTSDPIAVVCDALGAQGRKLFAPAGVLLRHASHDLRGLAELERSVFKGALFSRLLWLLAGGGHRITSRFPQCSHTRALR